MSLPASFISPVQLNTSSIKNKHTSFSIYKRIPPFPPPCFILANALNHALNLHFISCHSVFCGLQTKIPGKKKHNNRSQGVLTYHREKNVQCSIHGAYLLSLRSHHIQPPSKQSGYMRRRLEGVLRPNLLNER